MQDAIAHAIEAVARLAERSAVKDDSDYIQDGLLYCGRCQTPKQTRIHIPGKTYTVFCLCACAEEAQILAEQREREERAAENRRRRVIRCYGGERSALQEATFAASAYNRAQTDACARYAADFRRMLEAGRGLVLYGNCGVGKSYLAACIANDLLARGYDVRWTSISRVAREFLSASPEDKGDRLDALADCDLLVLDDYGAERRSDYVDEIAYTVINARSETRLPVVITTNLTAEELKNPPDRAMQRLMDRLLERCVPIHFGGESIRRQHTRETIRDWGEVT